MLKVGGTIYKAVDPGDGGGYAPQHLKILRIEGGVVYTTFSQQFQISDEGVSFYVDRGVCYNICCQLNGYKDSFDFWCKRMGIPDNKRDEELKHQMEIWGAVSYEDLCTIIL